MTRHVAALGIVLLFAIPLLAQVDSNDPNAVLAQKQIARQQERAATTQITVGQYEDMQDEIELLKSEVAGLQNKLALAGNTPQPAIVQTTPKKVYKEIELGMTKDELIDFVKEHHDMELGDFSSRTVAPDAKHPSTNPAETISRVVVTRYGQSTAHSGNRQFGAIQSTDTSRVAIAHCNIELTDDVITKVVVKSK